MKLARTSNRNGMRARKSDVKKLVQKGAKKLDCAINYFRLINRMRAVSNK